MKTTQKILILASLVFFITPDAHAQFKGLGNKLKKAAERKVEQQKRELKREGERQVTKKIDNAADNAVTKADATAGKVSPKAFDNTYPILNPTKTYKPSAEALAAVPQAADGTVMSGYNRSNAELFGAYEQLNPEFFPYAPYYKFPVLYALNLPQDIANYTSVYWNVVGKTAQIDRRGQVTITQFIPVQLKGEEVSVPLCETFMNAFAAIYAADPKSITGYVNFLKVCHTMKKFELTEMGLAVAPNSLVVNDENKVYMLETGQAWYTRWSNIVFHLANLASSQLDIETHTNAIEYLMHQTQAADEKGQIINAIFYLEQAELAYEHLKENPGYNPGDRAQNILASRIESMRREKYDAWREMAQLSGAEATDMPKTYTMDAKATAELTKLGKQQFGDQFVKAVFLSNQWKNYKSPEWPYPIIHRGIDAAFVIKMGDTYYLAPYDFQQMGDGSNWQNKYTISVPVRGGTQKKLNNFQP